MTYQDTHQDTEHLHTVQMQLSTAHAMALARFAKRVGWSECRANAVDEDQAKEIRAGVDALQIALAEAGFAPR